MKNEIPMVSTIQWVRVALKTQGYGSLGSSPWAAVARRFRCPLYVLLRHMGLDQASAVHRLRRFGVWLSANSLIRSTGETSTTLREVFHFGMETSLRSDRPPEARTPEMEPALGSLLESDSDIELVESCYRCDRGYVGTAVALYQRRWALTVLKLVLDRLHAEQTSELDRNRWWLARGCLTGEWVGPGPGLRPRSSEDAVTAGNEDRETWVRRLRKRFVDLLVEELGGASDPSPGVVREIGVLRRSVRLLRGDGASVRGPSELPRSSPAEDAGLEMPTESSGNPCCRCGCDKPLEAPWGLCPNCLLGLAQHLEVPILILNPKEGYELPRFLQAI